MTDREPMVRINGETFLYKAKSPFVVSGESVAGALEIDPSNDTVKCHECGAWFRYLGSHIRTHELTACAYKRKHGLQLSTSLVNEAIRQKMIKSGQDNAIHAVNGGAKTRMRKGNSLASNRKGHLNLEQRNSSGMCHAQLLERIKSLAADLGRTPTVDECHAKGISVTSATKAFNGPWKTVIALAGLQPRSPGDRLSKSHPKYSRAVLITILRGFYDRFGRTLTCSDIRRGLSPGYDIYCKYFGSTRLAYKAAGIPFTNHGGPSAKINATLATCEHDSALGS